MERVIKAIESSGLKKKVIAKRAGISEGYLSSLLSGKHDMSEDIRLRILSICEAVTV